MPSREPSHMQNNNIRLFYNSCLNGFVVNFFITLFTPSGVIYDTCRLFSNIRVILCFDQISSKN